MVLLPLTGKSNGEFGTLVNGAFHLDRASVEANDFPGDGQAQARALDFSAGMLDPIKPFKNAVQFVRWDSKAGVANRQLKVASLNR